MTTKKTVEPLHFKPTVTFLKVFSIPNPNQVIFNVKNVF